MPERGRKGQGEGVGGGKGKSVKGAKSRKSGKGYGRGRKRELVDVQRDTLSILAQGKLISRKAQLLAVKCCRITEGTQVLGLSEGNVTRVECVNADCLDHAIQIQKENERSVKVCVLVHGSGENPGGGYKKGASGQEEDICRRTNLVSCVEGVRYPLPEFGSLYIPSLYVIRGGKSDDFKTYRKILNMLTTLVYFKHSHIVLGAWGCGAYGNPGLGISRLMKKALTSKFVRGRFGLVSFAILRSKECLRQFNTTFGNTLSQDNKTSKRDRFIMVNTSNTQRKKVSAILLRDVYSQQLRQETSCDRRSDSSEAVVKAHVKPATTATPVGPATSASTTASNGTGMREVRLLLNQLDQGILLALGLCTEELR
ncbi:hypothetical protein AAMO2058_001710800 [Amorphochlora amoebiformis]